MDWCLLATGVISLGLTMVQQGGANLLPLFTGQGIDGILAGVSSMIVPVCLLGTFVLRFCKRVATRTWR